MSKPTPIKFDYALPFCTRSQSNSGCIDRSFGVKDRLGREIGASAYLFEATFALAEDDSRCGYFVTPGHYFGFCPQATRNGLKYGAVQSDVYFATAEERDAAVEAYFAGAAKRAAKTASK